MTKQIYWKCVDCNSMINDENMRLTARYGFTRVDVPRYAEFCGICCIYYPEVVLAYA